ncbi:hypothetical protein [Streptomyces chrestomyceticus]|uniref:hypothetical protein n=1 Tax=Streptomyces chrestomyceticus TaxID=68185 RepID=UPI0033C35D70
MAAPLSTVVIVSYGIAHHDAPPALRPVLVDATPLPRPAAASRPGQQLGGRDPAIRRSITHSPEGRLVVGRALDRIRQRIGPGGQVDVHVRSPDGRYRAPAVAEEIAEQLRALGVPVRITHLGRPDPPASR